MQLRWIARRSASRLTVMRAVRTIVGLALLCGGAAWAGDVGLKIAVAAPQGGCKGTLRRVSSAGETLWERPASFPVKIDLPLQILVTDL